MVRTLRLFAIVGSRTNSIAVSLRRPKLLRGRDRGVADAATLMMAFRRLIRTCSQASRAIKIGPSRRPRERGGGRRNRALRSVRKMRRNLRDWCELSSGKMYSLRGGAGSVAGGRTRGGGSDAQGRLPRYRQRSPRRLDQSLSSSKHGRVQCRHARLRVEVQAVEDGKVVIAMEALRDTG